MKTLSTATLLALCSITVHAEQYKFVLPKVSISTTEQKQVHPIESIGEAVFRNGVKVPAFAMSVPLGTDDEDGQYHAPTANCHKVKCVFDMKLDAKLAAGMKVYNISQSNEWLLVPASWTRWQGAIGVNGNTALVMSNPTGKSNLSLYTVPACYGCALDAASIYFPAAALENKKAFNNSYSSTNVPLQLVQKNTNTVFFQYQLPQQYKTDGIAKYNPGTDDLYQSLKVSMAPEEVAQVRAMLNFFLLIHKN